MSRKAVLASVMSGASDFIEKPFDYRQIVELARECIRRGDADSRAGRAGGEETAAERRATLTQTRARGGSRARESPGKVNRSSPRRCSSPSRRWRRTGPGSWKSSRSTPSRGSCRPRWAPGRRIGPAGGRGGPAPPVRVNPNCPRLDMAISIRHVKEEGHPRRTIGRARPIPVKRDGRAQEPARVAVAFRRSSLAGSTGDPRRPSALEAPRRLDGPGRTTVPRTTIN